jgi:phosphatidate cytidylyltransferase
VTRLLSALVLLPIVIGLISALPPVATLLLCLLILVLSCLEYERMVQRSGLMPVRHLATAVTAVAFLGIVLGPSPALPFLLAATVVGILMVMQAGRGRRRSLEEAAATLFPVLYLAYPVAALVVIRTEFGPGLVLALLGTQVVSDSSQYYVGRLIGRTALAPAVSPKKTWEGAVGGLVGAAIVLPIFGGFWLPEASGAALAGVGVLLATVGIFGDLFESLIKRSVDMKDASALIPGHGGMLDRIDALLFSTPVFYLVLLLLAPGTSS